MSAPPTMPAMVSRLPKFGSRPKSASLSNGAQTGPAAGTRLTNGFYHHPGPAGVNGGLTPASAKQNGFIRVPTSYSMKWKRESEPAEDEEWSRGKGVDIGQNIGQNRPGSNALQYSSQRDAKKTTAAGHGFGLPVTSSVQTGTRTLPVPKSGSVGSKPSQTGLNGTAKPTPNGLSGSKLKGGTDGSLRQPHGFARPGGSGPGSRSGSPLQKKPPANRCRSSDSLGPVLSAQLAESDRIRSRSLTQVRRLPSPPTLPPSSSSSSSSVSRHPTNTSSMNRAAGRGASSSMAPPKDSLAKPPGSSQTPKGGGGVKVQTSVERSGVSFPSLLPHSALKKPLLSSLGPAFKPSGISYKLSRPSLIKQSRPLRVTTANENRGGQEVKQRLMARTNSVETPSTTENSPESSLEAPEREGLVPQGEVSVVGETLEDMSLSSSSSLERNDTSQEYMDDFDNLGNGGVGLLLLSKSHRDDPGLDQSGARLAEDVAAVGGVAAALCFLDHGVDWSAMGGERGEHQLTRAPHRRRSSQVDYHEQGGSSLDLSPSDSCGSGGTYMWDEEGLEPLGGATTTTASTSTTNTTHHLGSFDSDLNSIDVLNNLDSCDLDDDDLMMDADLPEDASLQSEGGGLTHMAQWRMRQLCWGTQDVDSDSDFQGYKLAEDSGNKRTDRTGDKDLILDLCPPRSPCQSPGLGLDVEELAEDCCAVRSQLEYLQSLLLQEEDVDEDTLTTDTLSPETSDSSHTQDLLQEVQQLREELRSRDRTIVHLTLQLAVPTVTTVCRCQETTGTTDRHTQTSLKERESASQIFHASSQDDQEPMTIQAPPPFDSPSASSRPQILANGFLDRSDAADHRKEEGERRRTPNRSLQPPQPSKLRLFTAQSSRPPSRQLPRDPESSEVKMAAFTSGLSRLPKPKSH
ncbi:serine-rich coiled-coil domain-containing protein 2-like isoform X2 [Cyclopterus lumpus]|uniref:serine-rich coiled-coil domain-containing protein 2-like isoform X2 n=1 Tax=Cyclopterus lumpus TaxID=8103 RepID=UPI00148753E8|nr:serine-rich coiled-coil domain-containing protein 2-like isoform X2 [Cyclopterus lumpus]